MSHAEVRLPGSKKRRRSADAEGKRARSTRRPAESAPDAGGTADETPPLDARAKRRRASTRRAELNAALVGTAHDLRAALREMMERYELRVGGHLAELIQRVEGDAAGGLAPRPLPARQAEAMLEKLRAARLKPRKGRAKDFARLEALVEAVLADAPED
jgi:hypothetical protein